MRTRQNDRKKVGVAEGCLDGTRVTSVCEVPYVFILCILHDKFGHNYEVTSSCPFFLADKEKIKKLHNPLEVPGIPTQVC